MFYYKSSNISPQLEVGVQEIFTEEDFNRMFLFIDALIDSQNDTIVFKVLPEFNEQFQALINNLSGKPFFMYNMTVNVA